MAQERLVNRQRAGLSRCSASAALGDKDRTFAALRRVCRERDGAWGASVKVDPLYDGLRYDPRYGEILDCLNLR